MTGVLTDRQWAVMEPLVACLVQSGTKVVTTDAGFASHDIMVIEGDHADCEGNIPSRRLNF